MNIKKFISNIALLTSLPLPLKQCIMPPTSAVLFLLESSNYLELHREFMYYNRQILFRLCNLFTNILLYCISFGDLSSDN
ncbi:hypothetical protein CW304_13155 [Bacillus sp. UFRGS-B20]|nr:hypothetical protein CW304_13155 [Bacillus sp. UFRGS-B20]